MDEKGLLKALLELAENVGVELRQEALGGEGGGLCVLRGKKILFVDVSADLADQIARTAESLAGLDILEECYILPQVREVLNRYQNKD